MNYCIRHPETKALFVGWNAKFNDWDDKAISGWKVVDKTPRWSLEFPVAHQFDDKILAEIECRTLKVTLKAIITHNAAKKEWLARK